MFISTGLHVFHQMTRFLESPERLITLSIYAIGKNSTENRGMSRKPNDMRLRERGLFANV